MNSFDLDVVYVSGKSQVVAYPLSRLLSDDAASSPADPMETGKVSSHYAALGNSDPLSHVSPSGTLRSPNDLSHSPKTAAQMLSGLCQFSAEVVSCQHRSKFYDEDPLLFSFASCEDSESGDV